MHKDISQIIITREQIEHRVLELGKEITRDFHDKTPLLVGILNGAVIFFSDLIRVLDFSIHVDFMAISSYGEASKSTGVVRIIKDLNKPIHDRHIIIVEDIIDSGLTLSYLKSSLISRGVASLSICTLLDKPERRVADVSPDYVGFVVPDEFLVGYGLDYAESYRNLPYIGVLKRDIYDN